MDNLKDKTVIITGGSEGVGAATARRFAAAGAKLLLVARSKKNLEKIAEELRPLTEVHIFAMDVADSDARVNLFKKAEFEFGAVHILVNNAAYHKRGLAEAVDAEDLGRMIDVNLKAPIVLSRLALPHMRKAEGGAAIINVASLAGRAPIPGNATYSASKFGLRVFTFALADELRDADIKLGVVSPGPIDTAFIMEHIDDVADVNFSQPLSTPEEVADEILKLCLNNKREKAMPLAGGVLTLLTYLFPRLRDLVQPALERRGRRVKRELKAKMAAQARSSQP
jgi:short-subunit dehydrogenase